MQINTLVCCDFCSQRYAHSDENVVKMREHESACRFNPANKTCLSCYNLKDDYCGAEYCGIHVKDFIDIRDDGLSCEKWEENR